MAHAVPPDPPCARKRGLRITTTAQEHSHGAETTPLEYVLQHVPDHCSLKEIIDTYPEMMGDDLERINTWTLAARPARHSHHATNNLGHGVWATLARFE